MARKYGINVISLWQHCMGRKGMARSIEIALKAGYDGIYALPVRWAWDDQRKLEEHVIAHEDAWMYGSFWQMLQRSFGILGEPAPNLYDWVLFGRKTAPSYRSDVLYVQHLVNDGNIIEISPELSIRHDYYLHLATHGYSLCLDTWHLIREGRHGTPGIPDYQALVDALPISSVKLIHVHLPVRTIPRFLLGRDVVHNDMICHLGRRFPDAHVIVEVFPSPFNILGKKATIMYVSRLLKTTKRYAEG